MVDLGEGRLSKKFKTRDAIYFSSSLLCKKVMCQNRLGKFIGHRLSPNLETDRTIVGRSLKRNLEFVNSMKAAYT